MPLFYRGSLCLLCVLTLVRWVFPGVMTKAQAYEEDEARQEERLTDYAEDAPAAVVPVAAESNPDEGASSGNGSAGKAQELLPLPATTHFDDSLKHRFYWLSGTWVENFPDVQDVQYPSAVKWGIEPMRNRDELSRNMDKLVYVGSNPYIHLDENMSKSIPYLVPRASDLLEHLGKAFVDSLYAKRIPLHKFVVSSVLRTEKDVAELSSSNVNATERSCHLFGTTFDISYTRFYTVSNPDEDPRRLVRDDTLKQVLGEVLRDARLEGRCYVRHEAKQPCFHITVR